MGAGTSLVSIASIAPCRTAGKSPTAWWWSPVTGEVHPWRCKRNRCPWCGPINAHLVAGAIALAEPERVFTLTLVGDDWQTIRSRVNRVTYDVRAAGGQWNVAWHVEENPRGTGHHVHGVQWGTFVPQRTLSWAAARRGMGFRAHIAQVRETDRASAYGLKLAAAAYSLKGADGDLERFLGLNGARMVHASRGFWRDGPGRPIRSVHGAVQMSMRRMYGDSSDRRWTLVTHHQAVARGLVGPDEVDRGGTVGAEVA